MKSFKQFREECSCKEKETKSKKKVPIEIMPRFNDGQKGMIKKEQFAGNYPGPLYAPHPDIKRDK
jgi:hypothetical protein